MRWDEKLHTLINYLQSLDRQFDYDTLTARGASPSIRKIFQIVGESYYLTVPHSHTHHNSS